MKYKFEKKYKNKILELYTIKTNDKYEIAKMFLQSQEGYWKDAPGVQYIITI